MDDHERPLNPRGQAGAAAMATWLNNLNSQPDHAIVSDAARTRETWDILAGAMPQPSTHEFTHAMYLAGPEQMLDMIQKAPETSQTLMLIGHQPGMSALVKLLSDGSEPTSRSRAYSHFPTASTALVDVPVDSWAQVDFGKGVFSRFSSPKELASA